MTRVLIVEDEPQLRRALGINLRARRYEVEGVADGAGALRAAATSPPDLVILDLGLPDMDGVEVVHGLRGWTRIPIIILSARDSQDDKVDTLDAGADDYLTKPFGMDELEVWGPTYGAETNYLRVYMAQLRRKLEPEPTRPRHLITEPGLGYRFEP